MTLNIQISKPYREITSTFIGKRSHAAVPITSPFLTAYLKLTLSKVCTILCMTEHEISGSHSGGYNVL
jgi:hypothetical protein